MSETYSDGFLDFYKAIHFGNKFAVLQIDYDDGFLDFKTLAPKEGQLLNNRSIFPYNSPLSGCDPDLQKKNKWRAPLPIIPLHTDVHEVYNDKLWKGWFDKIKLSMLFADTDDMIGVAKVLPGESWGNASSDRVFAGDFIHGFPFGTSGNAGGGVPNHAFAFCPPSTGAIPDVTQYTFAQYETFPYTRDVQLTGGPWDGTLSSGLPGNKTGSWMNIAPNDDPFNPDIRWIFAQSIPFQFYPAGGPLGDNPSPTRAVDRGIISSGGVFPDIALGPHFVEWEPRVDTVNHSSRENLIANFGPQNLTKDGVVGIYHVKASNYETPLSIKLNLRIFSGGTLRTDVVGDRNGFDSPKVQHFTSKSKPTIEQNKTVTPPGTGGFFVTPPVLAAKFNVNGFI